MSPCRSDYIIISQEMEGASASFGLLPFGIVVAPSGFPAWLRIIYKILSLNSPSFKSATVLTLYERASLFLRSEVCPVYDSCLLNKITIFASEVSLQRI